jgi:hypothetical protein
LKQLPSLSMTKPKFFMSRMERTQPATVTWVPPKGSASL